MQMFPNSAGPATGGRSAFVIAKLSTATRYDVTITCLKRQVLSMAVAPPTHVYRKVIISQNATKSHIKSNHHKLLMYMS